MLCENSENSEREERIKTTLYTRQGNNRCFYGKNIMNGAAWKRTIYILYIYIRLYTIIYPSWTWYMEYNDCAHYDENSSSFTVKIGRANDKYIYYTRPLIQFVRRAAEVKTTIHAYFPIVDCTVEKREWLFFKFGRNRTTQLMYDSQFHIHRWYVSTIGKFYQQKTGRLSKMSITMALCIIKKLSIRWCWCGCCYSATAYFGYFGFSSKSYETVMANR